MTANLIRANQTSLELELEKSDSPPIVLPVMYNAMVPEIIPAPDIKLRACFIEFPYKNEIQIASNDIWGYFTLEEPEVFMKLYSDPIDYLFDILIRSITLTCFCFIQESTLEVDVSVKEGLIEPNSVISLPVTIKTSVLGVQEFAVR